MQLTFGIVSSWEMLWITTVTLSAFIHFYLIEILHDKPKYLHWGVIRTFFAVLYGAPLYYLGFYEVIVLTIFQGTSHFVIFNPLVNKLRDIKYRTQVLTVSPKYSFLYVGKDSGWLDKLFLRLGPTFYECFYFVCAAVMILSMITIYNRYAFN